MLKRKENSPSDMLTGQADGGKFSAESPSSQVTLICHKLTKTQAAQKARQVNIMLCLLYQLFKADWAFWVSGVQQTMCWCRGQMTSPRATGEVHWLYRAEGSSRREATAGTAGGVGGWIWLCPEGTRLKGPGSRHMSQLLLRWQFVAEK